MAGTWLELWGDYPNPEPGFTGNLKDVLPRAETFLHRGVAARQAFLQGLQGVFRLPGVTISA